MQLQPLDKQNVIGYIYCTATHTEVEEFLLEVRNLRLMYIYIRTLVAKQVCCRHTR